MASMACPECNAPVAETATKCKSCGLEFGEPPPPPKKPPSDAAQYAMWGGIALAVVVLLIVMASAMGGTSMCQDCRGKGAVKCLNCKDGRSKCIMCKGTGSDPQNFSTCQRCSGTGVASVCERCKGNPKKTCPSCGGAGKK